MFSFLLFFFSSRRRHTRWTGDWSSDVCSSDLKAGGVKLCSTDAVVRQAAKDLLGKTLVTAQTGAEGLPVHRLLVEQALPIDRSEERRVGKECRSRGSPYHEKKKSRYK